MNEITITRTPEIIGAEIRTLTRQAKYLTLWYGIEIGRRLCEAKELVGHGEWLNYLAENTEFSQPSASRFMKLFNEYGADQNSLFGAEAKYSTLNNLSVSNALRLLAVPEEERESFAAEIDAEHISTRELEKAIAERDTARRLQQDAEAKLEQAQRTAANMAIAESELRSKLKDTREALEEAENDLDEFNAESAEKEKSLLAKIKELEARPIETVFERDEKAIAEAAAEAKAEAEAEIARLKAAVEKAEAKADKANKAKEAAETKAKGAKETADAEARKQIAAAEENAAREALAAQEEAAELRQQLADAKRRLKTADPDTAIFKAFFEETQKTFNTLVQHYERAAQNDEAIGSKLKAAMIAMLDHCRAQIDNT